MSKELKALQERAATYNVAVTDKDTEETLREKLLPIDTAIADRDTALAEKDEAHAAEIAKIKGEDAVKDHGNFTLNKKKYEFTVPEFRYQGEKLKSKDLNANDNKEILEALVKTKSFVLKEK